MSWGTVLRAVGSIAILALAVASAPGTGAAADPIVGPQDADDLRVDSPWQAGTCHADVPTCGVAVPGQYYERAAGHPPVGFTQFIVNLEPNPVPLLPEIPVGNLRTVRVDLPPGLTVNPQSSAAQCEIAADGSPGSCALSTPQSKVGTSAITAINTATGLPVTLSADVYNLVPLDGEPARFGFSVLDNDVFLEAEVEWEGDYHEYFTIHVARLELPPIPFELARVALNRLVFDGMAGADGAFITTPTTCLGPAAPGSPFEHVYSTWLRSDGYEPQFLDPAFPAGSPFVESKIARRAGEFETAPKDCETVPFNPSIAVEPGTESTDSPAGAAVTVSVPELTNPGKSQASQGSSHVRSARVGLPPGMGLNPAAAAGLVSCDDSQFRRGSRTPVACPPASRIGSVEVETPPLPEGALRGDVYVGRQLSRDPASGDLYRIFVSAESSRYDISARLLGRVAADPRTGRVTTVFDDEPRGRVPIPGLPQVPFEAFRIKLDGGARAVLTSPPTCGPNEAGAELVPWSSARGTVAAGQPGGPSTTPPARPVGAFSLARAPAGAACAATLAERPFAPGFGAAVDHPRAGAFSPLSVSLSRPAGEGELKGTDVILPPGLSAKLAGVAYCPEAALAAAAAGSGAAEAAAPSCPAASFLGPAAVAAGSGPEPLRLGGRAYLAGPHRGAPLSLAVLTPALAGPYDLGAAVVRVALFVDPRTAQVRAETDAIPHVHGGATLSIRSVDLRIDRPEFTLNPTGCAPRPFGGALLGGGADPLDPAAFSRAPVSAPFRATSCGPLRFGPRLHLRTFGATRRAKNPKLRAVLLARPGQANIGRAAVILPPSVILDQSSIAQICTRARFAERSCPRSSIYGHARAISPLLDRPLAGPVYLRSSDSLLPDLVADLRGQVNIELAARIDGVRGRLRSTFDVVPDVPVRKFVLTMRGGRDGLLINSGNLCRRRAPRAIVRFKAHNGKRVGYKRALRAPCRGR